MVPRENGHQVSIAAICSIFPKMTSIPTRALARPSQIIGCIETELLTRSHKSERELLCVRGGLTAALHCNGSSPRGGTPRRHASARRSKSGSLRLRACVLYSEQKNVGISMETRRSRRVASDSARSYRTRPFQSLPRAGEAKALSPGVRAARRSLLAPSSTPTS